MRRTYLGNFWSLIVLGVLALGCGGSAAAQDPRPPLSPYLDFFREDTGVLPRYQQFVRPKIDLNRQLVRQDRQLSMQRQQLRAVSQGLTELVSGQVRPTGTGAGFMVYSHYYNLPGGRGR